MKSRVSFKGEKSWPVIEECEPVLSMSTLTGILYKGMLTAVFWGSAAFTISF